MNRPRRLTDGPITPALLRLAWPVFVSHALYTLYGLADTIWVGRLSAEAIGAVSTCFFASWALLAIGDLFIAGVTALVSQAVGAKREHEAAEVVGTAVTLALLAGAAVAGIGWFGARPLFALLFDDPDTVRMGTQYLSLYCLLAPVFYVSHVIDSIYRASGDTHTPMLVLLVGTGLNIALDPLLILGIGPFPRLEVQGAALATIVGQTTVIAIYGALYLRGHFPIAVGPEHLVRRFSVLRARQILRIGSPTALIGILFSTVYLVLANFVGKFGAPALAALGIVNRLESLNYLTANAMGMGVATLVGQNLGAGQTERAETSADRGALLITVTTGLMTALYLICPEWIARLFTSDPAALAEAVVFLRIVALAQILMGWELVYGQAFTGAGDTIPPLYASIVTSVVRIPLAWWLAFHTDVGLISIWWIISITGILRGLWVSAWFKLGRWKERGVRFDSSVTPTKTTTAR